MKHRLVRTPFIMRNARKKATNELEIEPFVARNSSMVKVIPIESLPNKVLMYMD